MSSSNIMERLRSETSELHKAVEQNGFQQALVGGSLPRGAYEDYLAQLLLVHRALETPLRARMSEPPFNAVLAEYQFQEPYLLEDLAYFGRDVSAIESLPKTADLIGEIQRCARREPIALLGYHYVLEGSNNGGKFIARAIRGAYRLEDKGIRYLDPYGPEQRERWVAFKESMSEVEFSATQADHIVAAAKSMFVGVNRMLDDLGANHVGAKQVEAKTTA